MVRLNPWQQCQRSLLLRTTLLDWLSRGCTNQADQKEWCLAGIQVKEAGLATHYLASDQLPSLLERLEELGPEAGSSGAISHLLLEAEVSRDTSCVQHQHKHLVAVHLSLSFLLK